MSTVGKALTLLDLISRLDREAGLTEIARVASLDKATARRLLVDLEKHGFVEQDRQTRRYRLGAAPLRLARIREQRFPFFRVAAPLMKDLAEQTGETVHLAELSGGRLSTIHVEEARRAHRVNVPVGINLPFHATASGLAFLAASAPKDVEHILSLPLQRYTDHTLTDPQQIRQLIAEASARGFSIGNQGLEADVISAAAPIRAPDGRPFGTIAVAAPLSRIDTETMSGLGAKVAAASHAIMASMYGVSAGGEGAG